MTTKTEDFLEGTCSAFSHRSGEELIGTATLTRAYLLLEYNGAWESRAFEKSDLPEAVKAWLNVSAKAIPDARLLLIKRPDQPRQAGVRFFVGAVREQEPAFYSFHLESYEELLGLDIPAILAGVPDSNPHRHSGTLWLVCTNGRRDSCCARDGVAVYNMLAEMLPGDEDSQIWQCTHIGGHRFAANLLCLPKGLLYGRVHPDSARDILQAFRGGQIFLQNLRGRMFYESVVQAADYFLCQESGDLELGAFRLVDAEQRSLGEWRMRFFSTKNSKIHQIDLIREESAIRVYESCQMDKTTPAIQHHLVAYNVLDKA